MSLSLQGYSHLTSPHISAQLDYQEHGFSSIKIQSRLMGKCQFQVHKMQIMRIWEEIHRKLTCAKLRASSLCSRSARPANRLPPPERTTFASNTARSSGSQLERDCAIKFGIVFGILGIDCYRNLTSATGTHIYMKIELKSTNNMLACMREELFSNAESFGPEPLIISCWKFIRSLRPLGNKSKEGNSWR